MMSSPLFVMMMSMICQCVYFLWHFFNLFFFPFSLSLIEVNYSVRYLLTLSVLRYHIHEEPPSFRLLRRFPKLHLFRVSEIRFCVNERLNTLFELLMIFRRFLAQKLYQVLIHFCLILMVFIFLSFFVMSLFKYIRVIIWVEASIMMRMGLLLVTICLLILMSSFPDFINFHKETRRQLRIFSFTVS